MKSVEETRILATNVASFALRPDNPTEDKDINKIFFVFHSAQVCFDIEVGQELILGRVHPMSALKPQVDLTAYGGLTDGISRLHASLQHELSGWYITDLNSSNGTWVNEVRLAPYMPYRLPRDNRILFTQLSLTIHFFPSEL